MEFHINSGAKLLNEIPGSSIPGAGVFNANVGTSTSILMKRINNK